MTTLLDATKRGRSLRILFATVAALAMVQPLSGCGDDGTAGDDDDDLPPPRRPDREGAWTRGAALTGGVGRGVKAVWLEDELSMAVAYFRTEETEGGPCFEDVEGEDVPESNEIRWTLEYAVEGFGGWSTEVVTEVLAVTRPENFDLQLDPSGTPQVTTWTGGNLVEPPFRFLCNAHDLGLFTRDGEGSWSVETVVAESDQAFVEGDGTAAASNFGSAVGYWPAFGYGPDGQLLVTWTDRHSGISQQDDFRRADLEVAYRGAGGGGFGYTAVDWGRGAGSFMDVDFDADGNPLVAYENRRNPAPGEDDARGIFVTRSLDGGETWETVRLLANRPSVQGLDMAVSPTTGEIAMLHYNPEDELPRLRTLETDGTFTDADAWGDDLSFADGLFDEGRNPTLAFDSQGRLAVAYYRCQRATATGDTCPSGDDALVFVWRDVDGTWSDIEVVDEGNELGQCGRTPSLVLEEDGSETYARIAYLCQDTREEGGTTLDDQLWVAERDPF